MALKVLDDAAQRILQDAVKLINQRPPYSPTRPPFNPDTPSLDTNSTPETYVCRIPTGGLPGLSLADILVGTSTSTSASPETIYEVQGVYCQVYQVDNKDGVLRQVPGNTPYVYNLSSSSIPEDTWVIVVKDNYGDWYAIASVVDTSIGTGTGTHEHIGGTPCDSLALIDQYDCLYISTTTPCGTPFETYLRYAGGHWTSEDIFCYIGGSGTFDFYFEAGRFHLKLDSKELLDCGTGCFTGAWITGHWVHIGTSSGTHNNPSCSGPTFSICLECTCCPIPNWQGSGYYCIVDIGFTGTGTASSNCEPVILEDKDRCSDMIVICSGRYETLEEVLAACSVGTGTSTSTSIGIVLEPCVGRSFGLATAQFTMQTGDCTCLPDTPLTGRGAGVDTIIFDGTACPGNLSYTIACVSGQYILTDSAHILTIVPVSITVGPPTILVWDLSGYGALCGASGGTCRFVVTIP